nr:hypothetical protein [uncultured bacterium]
MASEVSIERAKEILSDPRRAQRMQRLLNAQHELRNARISSGLLFISFVAIAATQGMRYINRGELDFVNAAFSGFFAVIFLISLIRVTRASIALASERASAG